MLSDEAVYVPYIENAHEVGPKTAREWSDPSAWERDPYTGLAVRKDRPRFGRYLLKRTGERDAQGRWIYR